MKDIIVKTLHEEVAPAIGCTEPVAVALAAAKARELLSGEECTQLKLYVSANIYKNGLSVGIPNTEEVGLFVAAALGVVGGDSEKDLEIFKGMAEDVLERAHGFLNNDGITIEIKDSDSKVYIEAHAVSENHSSQVIIKDKHNRFIKLVEDGQVTFEIKDIGEKKNETLNPLYDLKVIEIVQLIEQIDHDQLAFMLDGYHMNHSISQVGQEKKLGMGVGYTFKKSMDSGFIGKDLMNDAMMMTAAASDARMSGLLQPVMSSNGSGNNGLTAILPIVAYTKHYPVSDEKLAKAIAMSHMVNSYIKNAIGRLSALCGCGMAAGAGASVAITWLMGGNAEQIEGVIQNVLGNISGMICDGAKVGCAMKLATSASVAIQSSMLAMNECIVQDKNGIVGKTCEQTIHNLALLSEHGMSGVDPIVLQALKSN